MGDKILLKIFAGLRKIVLTIALAVLLFAAFTAVVNAATIYVPDDQGTIQDAVNAASPDDTIIVRDGTYTENVDVNKRLTIRSENGAETTIVQAANPNDHVFEVTADDVTISGFTVKGATGEFFAGIYLSGASNCIISDNKVSNNFFGIWLLDSSGNTLTDNTASNNDDDGIRLRDSSGNELTGNTASNGGNGIYMYKSNGNELTSNTANWNRGDGIALDVSSDNTLTSNTASNNVEGIALAVSNGNTLTSNTANWNRGDGISLWSSSGHMLTSNTASNNWCGIRLDNSSGNTLTDNTANSNNVYGIWLDSSSGNTLTSNTASNRNGIYLYKSNGNSLTSNIANSNTDDGIYLGWSSDNTLTSNTLSNNDGGINLVFSNDNTLTGNTVDSNNRIGIRLESSSGNELTSNTADSNNDGIGLLCSSGNTLTSNTVSNNDNGIYLFSSSNNKIYINNFISNTNNVHPDGSNDWNSPSKITYTYKRRTYRNYLGNYWDDYTDVDANNDGIWDNPYPIDSDSDNYPLVGRIENHEIAPYYVHDMAVTDVYTDPSSPYVGQSATVSVTVKNEGDLQENNVPVTVKAYVGLSPFGHHVGSTQVTLSAGESTKESFTWTPSMAKTYYIKGEVGIVGGERDTSDNEKRISVSVREQNQAPTCAIELRKNGVEIDEINVGEFFDIDVGDSTDDQGIKEVRFSSDDSQDGNPTGEWTEWYNWDISSGDWDAVSKTKAWLFATEGSKEVWEEVKDNAGQTGNCFANIYAGDPREIEINKYGLFGANVGFKNNGFKDYIVSFEILDKNNEVLDMRYHVVIYPAIRKISEKSFELPHSKFVRVSIVFDPLKKEDLEVLTDIKIKITYSDENVNVERLEELHFKEYSNIAATNFDMTNDAYSFSNTDWVEGKCYGMAATSILYFNGKLLLPPDKTTYDLDMEEPRPKIKIDEYQESWSYNNIIATWLELFGNNKMKEEELFGFGYKDLKENIGNGEPMIFFLGGKGLGEGHAVVAYKIVEDETNKASYILAYDPNYPYKRYFFEAFPYITYDRNLGELISYVGYTKFKLAKAEPWYNQIIIWSPASLRVYDSQGRVTGLVNGEVKNEIPYSMYEKENETITIFFPFDSYRYEVVGTEEGAYRLRITSAEDGEAGTFTATGIPTTPGAVHQYTINWDTLSQGEKGVTVQIDSDGDGIFEQTVTTDDTFQLPIASFTYSPAHPVVNQPITFNASSSYDPDGNIMTYEWNFGDGNITNTTEEIITHAYASAGDYTVNLTVTDNDGATSTYTQSIFINRIQKGISYAAWWHDTYATNDSDTSLENLKDTCTEWVSLVVTWYQDNASSTEIYRDDNRTPSDDSLIHAINKIHSLNMSVMLKPTVDLQDENWRGNINFDNIAYSDALGLGWQDWSWDCNRNFESTTSVYRGKYAINVSFEPWGGLSFANPESVNTDRYDSLEFYINGGERGGQQLRLSVTDDKGNELPSSGGVSINNPKYVHDGIISAKAWKLVSVPLEDLNATNTKIIRVNIMDNTGHAQPALYIDDVMLTAPQSKWNEWFSSYEQFILHYADLAEKNNCEQFCVGVEYKGTVHRENNWRDIIEKVREHYTGPITYASNWDNYQNINWWDASALDFVGIDAYFPLTEEAEPTVDELKEAWKKRGEEIESWQQRVNKSIIFTEIGYCSLDGTNIEPWNWTYSDIVDLQEQADCYNATFQTFWNKEWLAGIYWWMWDTDPDVGGPLDKSYTPYKKPAEGVVKKYYCAEKVSFLHKERLIGGPV